MSKYIYATVYEQFTGLKPPEPKSHKPRRRRGYGHPYRMRLNMQESEDQNQDSPSGESNHFNDNELDFQSEPNRQPLTQHQRHQNYSIRTTPQKPIECQSIIEEQKTTCSPKVTYKKRRHYEPAAGNGSGDSASL
ncbi:MULTISPECIES: hypothetical protein [unclassified Endozoicomonas]|uniref:hypothetical protein n=1 Tax=unclassified Endozoicomonas TaxID=2644528 RepID=UPI002147F208|nr:MULTISPECIES: hypothetical protein [unclassified Endozoicomonas]